MAEQYLTLAELAERFSMTPDTIRGLMRHGHLREGVHYFKPTLHLLRFKWSACEAWLTSPRRPVKPLKTEEEIREQAEQLAQQMLSRASR